MLGRINLSRVLLLIGGALTIVGFVAYFQDNPTLNLAGFFYGVPVLLGGLALRAAELEPVPFRVPTSEAVLKLREEQATPTLNQVRQDVTRYRFGQEAHLDVALEKLGLESTGEDLPQLQTVEELAVDGCYALALAFDTPTVSVDLWQEKQAKIGRFFGPSVRAEVVSPEEDKVVLTLIAIPDAAEATETAQETPTEAGSAAG